MTDEPTPEERHRIAALEMRIYDSLGPETRRAIAISPVSLDARDLPAITGMSTAQLRRVDAQVARQIINMLERDHGKHSGDFDWLRRPAPRNVNSLVTKYFSIYHLREMNGAVR